MASFCVATFNVGSLYANIDVAYPLLQKVISQYRPHVLCMQELPMEKALIDDLCQWGEYPFVVTKTTSKSHVNIGEDMGLAIFSRFPMGKPTFLHLHKPDREIFYKGKQEFWHDKLYMSVPLLLNSHTPASQIRVITGHGFPFHRYGLEKPEEAQLISPSLAQIDQWVSEFLQQDPAVPVVIAADFNLSDPTAYMPQSRQTLADVFYHQATRPSGRKTDAIFLPDNAEIGQRVNWISPKENEKFVFDHNFIAAHWIL